MKINQEQLINVMAKLNPEGIWNFCKLFILNISVQLKSFWEYLKVIVKYHHYTKFFKADLALQLIYLFDNPFSISKRFLIRSGEKEVYAYGETPLTSLDLIAKECQIKPSDTVFELGCGRGRSCFWLNGVIGCKVVGIDYVPEFISRAQRIANKLEMTGVEFREANIVLVDFTGATVFYLYGTCLEEALIDQLIAKFLKMPSGTKVITVSYPLTDYSTDRRIEVMKRFPAKFTWGVGDVYLNMIK